MSPGKRLGRWLLKTEPEVFSLADLARSPGKRTVWDGVRNYQARNLLRDELWIGDLALFYHSEAKPPAAMEIVRVVRAGFPDPSQFDPGSPHRDPGSDAANPRWFAVEIALVEAFAEPVTLPRMRATPGLAGMELLRRGSRLSVQPVTAREWTIVTRLGRAVSGARD